MTAQESDQCHQCKHRAKLYSTRNKKHVICCYYIIDTGHRRGCPVAWCDKYEQGKALRRESSLVLEGSIYE